MVAPRFKHPAGTSRIICLLVFAVQITSCGPSLSTLAPIEDPETLIRAVQAAGASLDRVPSSTILVNLPDPQMFLLDGEMVQIGAAALQPSEAQALESASGNLRLWYGDGWYLAYAGREGGVILLLSGLLGEPLQEAQVVLGEPFPPAIPRAMRKLADALESSPSDLIVLDFQATTWQDSCLGIGSPSDDCAPGVVTGWTVSLLLNEVRYVLHSDDAGEIVRWLDPTEGEKSE